MLNILKKDEVNFSRQYNLDLLKALAIICMIICHAVMQLGGHREGYETEALYIFGDNVLGTYVAVAHAFMFAMGVGFMYSRKNTPGDLVKRGIHIYILAYVLNFFRYGIYAIGEGIITGTFREEVAYSMYNQDILHFAGLAMILTALFRKLKLKETTMLLIAVVMSAFASIVAGFTTGNTALDVIVGSFVTTTSTESCFTLCNWYIFVAIGMVFGAILKRSDNLDELYKRILPVSGIIMVIYLIATCKFGMYFLTKNQFYFSVSTLEAIGFLSIDFFLLSLFYYLLKAVNPDKFKVFYTMSKNVNTIYITHWVILGFLDVVLGYLMGLVLSYVVIYAIGIILIPVSFVIAEFYGKKVKRFKK